MSGTPDPDLFPPSFLRLLSMVPAAVPRLHAGVADGRRAVRGDGGRFLLRGHRAYRPGDDLRRLDWKVEARLGRLAIKQVDPEHDVPTEVWLDGSASMGPCGGRVTSARLAALAVAVALAGKGVVRLGVLRSGKGKVLHQARDAHAMRAMLDRIAGDQPAARADLAHALPRVVRGLRRGTRFLLISDLLTRTDPGVLHAMAGRGVRGAVLHLRVPDICAPQPGDPYQAQDVETGEMMRVALTSGQAARVAERARAHADRWAHRARAVGLRYLPYAPGEHAEDLLRRIVLKVP